MEREKTGKEEEEEEGEKRERCVHILCGYLPCTNTCCVCQQ